MPTPPGPAPEGVRREMGRIGVAVGNLPAPQFHRPWIKSEAVWRGALTGAGQTIGAGGAAGPSGAGVATIIAPFMAGVGAVTGPIAAIDDDVVRHQWLQLQSAVPTMDLRDSLRNEFLRVAHSETAGTARVEPFDREWPKPSPRTAPGGGVAAATAPDPAHPPGNAPDTVLELTITRFGLQGLNAEVNPMLHLFMEVRGRLVRTSDGRTLWASNWRGEATDSKTFARWAAHDAAALRAAFPEVCDQIVKEAVSELFTLTPIP